MHIAELTNWLHHNGYRKDNYGNWVGSREYVQQGNSTITSQEVRIKVQATSVRYERAYRREPSTYDPKPPKEWLNIASDYLKYVHIEEVTCKDGLKYQVIKIKNTRICSVQLQARLRTVWLEKQAKLLAEAP
jgi:hypothetical protein